jgi:hypothetical protein
MSKTLIAALALVSQDLQPGQVFSHHQVVLNKDGVDGDPVETTEDSVEFDDLEPGTYLCTAFSVDTTGAAMTQPKQSNPVVVTADTAMVVNSITLSLAPPVAPPPPAAPTAPSA